MLCRRYPAAPHGRWLIVGTYDMRAGGKTRQKLKTIRTPFSCRCVYEKKKCEKLKNNINEELWLLRHEDGCSVCRAVIFAAGGGAAPGLSSRSSSPYI